MIEIEVTETIEQPAERVLHALRDRIAELAGYMPNIETMEIIEREERPPVVYMHNRWRGRKDSFPAIARPFLTRNLVSWFDHAEWDESTMSCSWRIEPIKAKTIFSCSGSTALAPEEGDRCLFSLQARLELDLQRVPGLPRFLARRAQGPVERFVASSVQPNLSSLASAVAEYLAAKPD